MTNGTMIVTKFQFEATEVSWVKEMAAFLNLEMHVILSHIQTHFEASSKEYIWKQCGKQRNCSFCAMCNNGANIYSDCPYFIQSFAADLLYVGKPLFSNEVSTFKWRFSKYHKPFLCFQSLDYGINRFPHTTNFQLLLWKHPG